MSSGAEADFGGKNVRAGAAPKVDGSKTLALCQLGSGNPGKFHHYCPDLISTVTPLSL